MYARVSNAENGIENSDFPEKLFVDDDNIPTSHIICSRLKASWMSICHECCGIDPVQDDNFNKQIKHASTVLEATISVVFCWYFQYLIHDPFCDFLFKCGCVWVFKGGWDDCNYFNTSGLPKCPWCISRTYISWTTDYLVFALMVLTFIVALYKRKRVGILGRWLLPICSYFFFGTIVVLIFKLADKYPTFIF